MRISNFSKLILSSCAIAAVMVFHAHAQVAAKVDGAEIQASDVTLMEKELAAAFAQIPADQRKEAVLSYLIDLKLLSAAGAKAKLDQSADYKARLEISKAKVLGELYLEQESKKGITEADMKKFYDDQVKAAPVEPEVKARHILVEKEDEAKDLIKQIKGGADFAKLAKEKSKDPGAKDGGDLGYFSKEMMVPEFSEAAFKLEKGKMTETPVKTQFGWHVIKVEDKRNKVPPAFDVIKPQVQAFLERQAQSKVLEGLRKDAKIEKTEAKK